MSRIGSVLAAGLPWMVVDGWQWLAAGGWVGPALSLFLAVYGLVRLSIGTVLAQVARQGSTKGW